MVKKEQSTFVQHHHVEPAPAPVQSAPQLAATKVVPKPVPRPQVVELSKPAEVPPNFTKPVSTAIVTEGEKLFLEAQFEGKERIFTDINCLKPPRGSIYL